MMVSLLVARNEFTRNLKNKKKLVLTFLLTISSIAAALCINILAKPVISVGIIENKYNKEIQEKINGIENIKISKADKDTINTDMILSRYIAVIEVGKNKEIKVYSLDKNMKEYIENAVREIIDYEIYDKFEKLLSLKGRDNLTVAQRVVGFMFIILTITCTMSAAVMLKDKQDKILLRYKITPNKLAGYIFGNYLYNLVNTFIHIFIISIFMYMFKINIGITIINFIIIGTIIAMVSTSLAVFITVMSYNELQASLSASSLAIIMSLLGGTFMPIEKMPDIMKLLSNVSVTKWIMELACHLEKGLTYGSNLILILIGILISIGVTFCAVKIGEVKLKGSTIRKY